VIGEFTEKDQARQAGWDRLRDEAREDMPLVKDLKGLSGNHV